MRTHWLNRFTIWGFSTPKPTDEEDARPVSMIVNASTSPSEHEASDDANEPPEVVEVIRPAPAGKSKGLRDGEDEATDTASRQSSTTLLSSVLPFPSSSHRSDSETLVEKDVGRKSRWFGRSQAMRAAIVGPKKPPLPSEVTRKGPEGIVTIEVGVSKTRYYVHKDYLKHHSGYFRKALSNSWKEAEERLITFTDIEVAPFNVFIHWLYTQTIPKDPKAWSAISQSSRWKIETVELKALILADRFLTPDFAQVINNDLVNSRITNAPYYELVICAFEGLPESSPFLRCLVDTHVRHWEPKLDEEDKEEKQLRPELPHEYLVRVMVRYAEMKGQSEEGSENKLKKCDYHIHKSDKEKRSCKMIG